MTANFKFFLGLLAMSLFMFGCNLGGPEGDQDITDDISAIESDMGDEGTDSGEIVDFDSEQAEFEAEEDEEFATNEDFSEDQQATTEEPAIAETPSDSDQQMAQSELQTEPIVTQNQGPQNTILAINYLDSNKGGALEVKTATTPTYSIRPTTNNNQYVLEIQNAILPDSLKRPFIMKDFNSAFGTVNSYQNPGGQTARVVIQLRGSGEPVVTVEGNTLLVTAPSLGETLTAAKKEAKELDQDKESYNTKEARDNEKILGARTLDEFLMGGGRFFGRPISIQTNGADIRDVITFIAEESGVNLVMSDDVDGKISLKLRQVPWDQALVIVMRSKNLGYIRQGNVLRISKLETLQREAQAAKQIVDSQNKLEPLKVKVVPVSYAQVEELVKQIGAFLTERGKVVSDSRTSSLIITDTTESILKAERLIKELDIPPAQVMIEGKIVEAGETFTRRIGVNWGMSGSPVQISSGGGAGGSPILLTPRTTFQTLTNNQVSGGNAAFGLNVGSLDFLGSLDAALSLAQTDNLIKIISSPRIVAMNKEKAEIFQSGEIIQIDQTLDQAGNLKTSSKAEKIVLKLEVTPQITAEGSVILDLSLQRDFPGAESNQVTLQKPKNTRSAKTKILVQNGQTAVIGGIYQSDEAESETGTPGLKNVPVLGWLFKSRSVERTKNELLLFLTPRILNAKDQGVSVQ